MSKETARSSTGEESEQQGQPPAEQKQVTTALPDAAASAPRSLKETIVTAFLEGLDKFHPTVQFGFMLAVVALLVFLLSANKEAGKNRGPKIRLGCCLPSLGLGSIIVWAIVVAVSNVLGFLTWIGRTSWMTGLTSLITIIWFLLTVTSALKHYKDKKQQERTGK